MELPDKVTTLTTEQYEQLKAQNPDHEFKTTPSFLFMGSEGAWRYVMVDGKRTKWTLRSW